MNVQTQDGVADAERTDAPAGLREKLKAANKKSLRRILMIGGVGLFAIVAAAMWLMGGRYASTDDAYVQADKLMVTTDVSGTVLEVDVREGQEVRAGDVLFRLDPKPFEAALAHANAATARDQASLASANNDAKRYSILAKMGAASSSQRDQFVAQAQALTATVKADKAQADMAALNLQWSVIRSPVDGKTGPILIQPGNLIKANDTNPLVTITQTHPVKVSFFLPQSDLPQIQQRMAAGTLVANIQAHNATQTRESAKVDFVGNAVSANTGTIELRATFPNTDDRLVPGQVVDVAVALNQFDNVIVVPHDAVNVGPNGRYVYALENDNAVLVPVNVLNDDGKVAAVQGKLKVGQIVITDGQLRVIPGKPVTIAGKKGARGAKPAVTQ